MRAQYIYVHSEYPKPIDVSVQTLVEPEGAREFFGSDLVQTTIFHTSNVRFCPVPSSSDRHH